MPKFLTMIPRENESPEEFAKRVSEQAAEQFGDSQTPEVDDATDVEAPAESVETDASYE